MSNVVEIVKIIATLRARDLPALFYLYKSETTEVHQIAWLPKTDIALLVERHFMRNMIGIFEKFADLCQIEHPPVPLLKDDKCPPPPILETDRRP